IFPSTTLANMGLIPALANAGDLLVVDHEAHNSVHEAAKIAHDNGALLRALRPCEPAALEAILAAEPKRPPLVAVDGVYSMGGYSPPLRELDEVARGHGGTLYVDDAHGTG